MTDLTALRTAASPILINPDGSPVRWRVVSIEYGGAIAPACDATEYTNSLGRGGMTHPTHRLDPEVFGPDARDDTGIYDCCPGPHIEVWSDELAAYLVELLNTDAERDAKVWAAALAEAEAAVRAHVGSPLASAVFSNGVEFAADLVLVLKTAPR